jgi:hypothetical protein
MLNLEGTRLIGHLPPQKKERPGTKNGNTNTTFSLLGSELLT